MRKTIERIGNQFCEIGSRQFDNVMRAIKSNYEPSVLTGTVGRWDGTFCAYKYCHSFKELEDAICGKYDDVVIRQDGEKLYFTLIHHDGQHEMELRRLTDCDSNNDICWDDFSEETVAFINRHTKDFGRIAGFAK